MFRTACRRIADQSGDKAPHSKEGPTAKLNICLSGNFRAQEGYKDGKALTALFNFPKGLAYDSKGNLFIADMSNHKIRKLAPDGMVSTFAK